MALTATPPITLSAVCTEFGAPAGTPLAAFLRGGVYVPDTPTNAAVPAALPIALLDLLGASSAGGGGGGAVNLEGKTIFASRGAGIASANYRFNGSGTIQVWENNSAPATQPGEWLLTGVPSDYEVRVTDVHLAIISGITNNVWQSAASTWTASLSIASVDEVQENITVDLRLAGGDPLPIASAFIELHVERF